jgi:two-component system cell cycle response regulator
MHALDPEVFRQVVDTLPVGGYIVGLDRRIAFWNKAAEQITGYLSQEVIGRTCHEEDILMHCGARGTPVCTSAGCLLTCALRDGKQIEAVLFARHKDGHRIPVHVRSIPLSDAEGKIVAVAELFQQQGGQSELRWVGDPGAQSHDGLNGPSIIATETYLSSKLKSPESLAVFLVELEDKEAMAKQRGWEMVYTMTRTMVHTITDLLSMPHFLGRWRGDRFLIVVPNSTEGSFEEMLGQLEGVGNSCSVTWWGDRVPAQISVRGTLLHAGDSMETLLARIDPVKDR